MPKVPVYNIKPVYKPKHTRRKKNKTPLTPEQLEINARLRFIKTQLKEFKAERVKLVARKKHLKMVASGRPLTTVKLYALKLENYCWYIGISYNVQRRFIQHQQGGKEGALWTTLNKPIEIHEIRKTEFWTHEEVTRLEDDMTLEYALKFGSDKVRGGGYCQRKPRWPDVITQNEILKQ